MKALKFRPAARQDLDAIWDYSVTQWGTAQAESYLRLIQKIANGLCDGTATGQSADHILKGCRKIPAGSHTLYFHDSADDITVIRILHQRMDVDRHF